MNIILFKNVKWHVCSKLAHLDDPGLIHAFQERNRSSRGESAAADPYTKYYSAETSEDSQWASDIWSRFIQKGLFIRMSHWTSQLQAV